MTTEPLVRPSTFVVVFIAVLVAALLIMHLTKAYPEMGISDNVINCTKMQFRGNMTIHDLRNITKMRELYDATKICMEIYGIIGNNNSSSTNNTNNNNNNTITTPPLPHMVVDSSEIFAVTYIQ